MATAARKYEDDSTSGTDSDFESHGACCGDGAAAVGQKGPVGSMPPDIRRGFIRKVYSLLTVQLVITLAIGTLFRVYTSKAWLVNNAWVLYLSCFGSMGMMIGMACCCQQIARKYPTNYIFLFTFTIFMSVLVGFACMVYTGESVLIAVATTALVFFCLTAYACCTKTDFTGAGPYLMAALMTMLAFSLVMSLWSFFAPLPPWLRMGFAFMGVILFSFYIVYDTQQIVGGTHKKFEFDIDDYVFAALNLYLDIINLFLFLLQIFGARN
mmetsp:Transcript_117159/g.327909  ORF Transcript_117159/g.327909 Transcript_117159/m.327909 type:complete len:268 (-) Transcript_117159:271-1074(-)